MWGTVLARAKSALSAKPASYYRRPALDAGLGCLCGVNRKCPAYFLASVKAKPRVKHGATVFSMSGIEKLNGRADGRNPAEIQHPN